MVNADPTIPASSMPNLATALNQRITPPATCVNSSNVEVTSGRLMNPTDVVGLKLITRWYTTRQRAAGLAIPRLLAVARCAKETIGQTGSVSSPKSLSYPQIYHRGLCILVDYTPGFRRVPVSTLQIGPPNRIPQLCVYDRESV